MFDYRHDAKQCNLDPSTIQKQIIKEMNSDFSNEDEECRLCLRKGMLRRCCQKYYCHECFVKFEYCPGCGKETFSSGIAAWKTVDPGKWSVAKSWALSFLLVISLLAITIAFFLNDLTLPETIWKHKCQGWFPKCNIEACINLGDDPDSGLPNNYYYCDLKSTVNKVFGHICLYDPELYHASNKSYGYDFCSQASRGEKKNLFRNGVYIFEDNFDHWSDSIDYSTKSIKMASARWEDMKNAEASTICGYNTAHAAKKSLQSPTSAQMNQNAALVFSGVHYRYAETVDLDLKYGGLLEFYLKMAPILDNTDADSCKAAFGGDVTVSYSKDRGKSWRAIAIYPVWKYRGNNFTSISETLPKDAWSHQTRFRWSQHSFDSIRDYWALDDVSIFRNFHPEWQTSDLYMLKSISRNNEVQHAQCCYGTEQCRQYPTMFISQEECVGKFSGDKKSKLRLKLNNLELHMLCIAIAAIAKTIFRFVQNRLIRYHENTKRNRIASCAENVSSNQVSEQMFISKKFDFETHVSWKVFSTIFSASFFLVAVLCLHAIFFDTPIYHSFLEMNGLVQDDFFSHHKDLENRRYMSITILIFVTAIFLDFQALYWIWKNVLVSRKKWSPELEVNTCPSRDYLLIDKIKIPLGEIKELKIFPASFCWCIAALYIIGGFPFASCCIIIRSTWLPYTITSPFLSIFSFISILREISGPAFMVKIFLSSTYMLTGSRQKRDEMGYALNQAGVIEWMKFFAPLGSLISWLLSGLFVGDLFSHMSLISALVGAFFGLLGGSIHGMMQGLPVEPHIILSRWPCRGHSVRYIQKVRCPCLFTCSLCSELYSQHVLQIVFLDDMLSYKQLLRGERRINILNNGIDHDEK